MSSIQALRQGEVLTLVFSRPDAGNAFGLADAKDLSKILAKHKSVKLLVWRSTGRFFCAGGDLAAYAKMKKKSDGLLVNKQIAKALSDLAKFPAVTLAVVEGDCLGGGMEVLSCFDIVWSVPSAAFGLWQRRIGLSYGWGGGERLTAKLSSGRLKERALSAESFTAFRANEIGLVDKVIPAESLENSLNSFCDLQGKLAQEPIVALKTRTKKSEGLAFTRLWGNRFHSEILAKFKSRSQGGRG